MSAGNSVALLESGSSTATETRTDEVAAGEKLRARALRGSAWTIFSYAANNGLRLGSNLVLARLLFPEAFGVMALVNVFLMGLEMFSDVGIGPGIIYSKRGDDARFLNTAWTIQVMRGFAIWLVACAGAVPFANYYGEPALASLIPVAAFTAVLMGFNATGIFTASRELLLGKKTAMEITAKAAGAAVMIAGAFAFRSIWVLVAGALVASATQMLLSHRLLPGVRNRFTFEREAAVELFRFGRWIFVSTVITFFALQIDRLMLGKLVSFEELGLYAIASIFALFPYKICTALAQSVLFPVLSSYAREAEGVLAERFLPLRRVVLQAGLIATLGIAFFAPAFFGLLYDERYAGVGYVAQAIAVPLWFMILHGSSDRAVPALGDTRSLAASNAAALAARCVGCWTGFQLGGLTGCVLGLTLGDLAKEAVILRSLAKRGVHLFGQDAAFSLLAIGLLALGVLAPRLLPDGPWAVALPVAVFAVTALVLGSGVRSALLIRRSGGVA